MNVLIEQLKALNDPSNEPISRLCNMLAAIHDTLPDINWSGIYIITNDNTAILGPFSGRVACMTIAPGKGVIGKAVDTHQPIIVSNVLTFEGHIACDSASRSELVIPLYKDERLAAVLDLDSAQFACFDNWTQYIEPLRLLFQSVIGELPWI